MGIYVLNICLAGHSDEIGNAVKKKVLLQTFKKATRKIWQDQIGNAIAVLGDLDPSKPRYLVGYSAGAVLSLELIQRQGIVFERFLLFAPAISFRAVHRLFRYVPFNAMLIPSFLNEACRSNRGTPVSAYKAVIETSQDCHKKHIKTCLNIPALVVMDPRDEMLSIKGLRQFIADKKLDQWRLLPVEGQAGQGNYHHLVISKDFVGEILWHSIWKEIDQFMNNT